MIVVTGAAGQVGSVLVRELVRQNRKVKAIVLPSDNLQSLQHELIEIVEGDVRDKKFLRQAFSNARIVFHLAGIVSITSGNKKLIEEVNVEGTKNVIEACKETNVKRLVYTSSVHAFVELPHGQLINESAPIDPKRVVGDYAKSKAKATLLVKAAVEKGLDAVIVYPSGIIGPYAYTLSNMGQLFIDYAKGRIPVMIEGTYDFVDVRDVVQGILAASERAEKGENYILSGYQITLKQIFYILANITGRKPPKIYVPHWLLRLFVPFVTWVNKFSNKIPTLTSYALYTISSNSLFSHEKAREQLDYKPRHIVRTLKDTLIWYKKIKKL